MVEIKLRTDADFKAKLQELAKKDKRSLNKFIEVVLEGYVAKEKRNGESK